MNKEQFYCEKYSNFQKFCEANAMGDLVPVFEKYTTIPFNVFMIQIICDYVVPNKHTLASLIEQKLLEHELSLEDVSADILDKFRRYSELFCTFYNKSN